MSKKQLVTRLTRKIRRLNIFSGSVGLRSKLVISYIVIIFIPIVFLGINFYNISNDIIVNYVESNVYEIIKKNNEIVDAKLAKVVDASLSLIADGNLFSILSNLDVSSEKALVSADTKISSILSRYFLPTPEIYSYKLVTSYYTFTPDTGSTQPGFLPFSKFSGTTLYKAAMSARGNVVWVPTYDFVKEYGQNDLEECRMEGRYVFSAVRVIDCVDIVNGQVINLRDGVERPVLVVDFLPNFFRDLYDKSTLLKNTYYSVISKDGTIIAQSEAGDFSPDDVASWIKKIGDRSSGYEYVTVNGQPQILCFDTSRVTDWVTLAVINPRDLTRPIVAAIGNRSINLAILLSIVAMIIAYRISTRVINPINKLTRAARKIGSGNFDVVLPEEGDVEFIQLIRTINNMSKEIKTLIKENYEVKLREKEAAIDALTLQLNPHFLYNTINIINWLAIRNKQKDISKMLMSLSHMLNYTIRSKTDIVAFREDLEWLQKYLYIMSIRFGDKFTVEYDIDPDILDIRVPKLFLQPIIENVFSHAFENLIKDGFIKISAHIKGSMAEFSVEDNGKGINPEDIDKILSSPRKDSISIGLPNVNRRIKLIYGEEYGIKMLPAETGGTVVQIAIPLT